MRKNIAKFAAVGLSLALVVTSVNLPSNTASAAAKKAKLSATKKTITAKKSATLKLKKKKGGATIKLKSSYVKVSTSKKSIATVKAVKKNKKVVSYKVSAKKAGKATITIKVKKGTYKGTYKCKVTVKAVAKPKVTAKPTAKPSQAPASQKPSEPTAKPSQGPNAPSTEPSQTPIVGDVAKVSAMVTNSVKGHENTILAGQDATIQVLVTDKDGNPVANDNVVLTFKEDTANTNKYAVSSLKVATTDSKGIATFVVSPIDSKAENTDNSYLGSYDIKVTEASKNISGKAKLNVATISFDSEADYGNSYWNNRKAQVMNLNGTAGYADIKKGNNSKISKVDHSATSNCADGYTTSVKNLGNDAYGRWSGGSYSQYAGTQQVSAAGADHKVAFKSAVYLVLPGTKSEEVKDTTHVQTINKKSGNYGTYTSKSEDIKYDISNLNNVRYATLTFNEVTVSRYTKLEVWAVNGNEQKKLLETYGGKDKEFSQKNFGLQIPVADLINGGSNGLRLVLTSEGQVNTDKNSGFDVKDLTYVYKSQGTVDGKTVLLDSAKVAWKQVTPVYSKEEEVTAQEKSDICGPDAGNYVRVTKTIPVFPYVGNAIIKCYDKNNNIRRYYACAIQNEVDWSTGSAKFQNKNVLDVSRDCYVISEQEATKSVGTVTDKGDGTVEIDSTESGTTYLEGTVSCNDEYVKIDARNEKVYTSVMWNPIAQGPVSVERGRFAAVEGQNVTFTAQLVDKNNNPVSVNGEEIEWTVPQTLPAGVTQVIANVKTDTKGQAALKLNATQAASIYGIKAKHKDSQYDVVLLLGGQKVSMADIHWISLNLAFKPSVDDAAKTTTKTSPNGAVTTDVCSATVGETWEYAAYVEAALGTGEAGTPDDKVNVGQVDFKSVTGIAPKTVQGSGSAGTAKTENGKTTVSSNSKGDGTIINTLDGTIKTEGGSLTLADKNQSWVTYTLPFVGEGAPNVDEELTIKYNFAVTGKYSANWVFPTGINALVGKDKVVYVKVVDEKGNAKDGVNVSYWIDTKTGAGTTSTTDGNGIIAITVPNASKTAGSTSTVIVETADIPAMNTIINWKEKSQDGFLLDGMSYDADAKTVKITMKEEVCKDSVLGGEFSVKYTAANGDEATYDVAKAEANGKDIILTLPKSAAIDMAAKEAQLDITVISVLSGGMIYEVTSGKTGEALSNGTVFNLKGNGTKSQLASAEDKKITDGSVPSTDGSGVPKMKNYKVTATQGKSTADNVQVMDLKVSGDDLVAHDNGAVPAVNAAWVGVKIPKSKLDAVGDKIHYCQLRGDKLSNVPEGSLNWVAPDSDDEATLGEGMVSFYFSRQELNNDKGYIIVDDGAAPAARKKAASSGAANAANSYRIYNVDFSNVKLQTPAATATAVPSPEPVAAPLVDHPEAASPAPSATAIPSDKLTDGTVKVESSLDSVNTKGKLTVVNVKVTAKDLVKHYNGGGMQAYWIGIGVPKVAATLSNSGAGITGYDSGFGYKYSVNMSENKKNATSSMVSDGNDMATFYAGWLTPDKKTPEKEKYHVTVDNGNGYFTIYNVDFSGVTLKN